MIKFPTKSTAGNTDILILFGYDSNSIHVEPIPSRSGYQILLTYQRMHRLLVSRGLRPKFQTLDNECSAALIHYLDKEAVEFQLAPPQVHHRNATERAIRTSKNYFIDIFCGCNRNFPMNLWDNLILQAILTMNLLRCLNLNPDLSAFAQVWG